MPQFLVAIQLPDNYDPSLEDEGSDAGVLSADVLEHPDVPGRLSEGHDEATAGDSEVRCSPQTEMRSPSGCHATDGELSRSFVKERNTSVGGLPSSVST